MGWISNLRMAFTRESVIRVPQKPMLIVDSTDITCSFACSIKLFESPFGAIVIDVITEYF